MADEKGKPIFDGLGHTVQSRSLPQPDNDLPKPCVACGTFHGSIGVHLHCLENLIARFRAYTGLRGPP